MSKKTYPYHRLNASLCSSSTDVVKMHETNGSAGEIKLFSSHQLSATSPLSGSSDETGEMRSNYDL